MPTNSFVFYSRCHLRIDLAHDATVGERRMGNKKFPTLTKIDLGDDHLQEGEVASTYPCRSLSGKR